MRKFGEETLDIIEREPNRLTEVDGIGEAKAHVIIEGYRAHREFAEISVFLRDTVSARLMRCGCTKFTARIPCGR
ncbi:MAG: hypothetical protein V8Q39_00575 [Anaerovoracaceae bacterium]